MAQNRAAWITSEKASPLQVDDAPMPKPGPGEVVFKNQAVAVVGISIFFCEKSCDIWNNLAVLLIASRVAVHTPMRALLI